MLDEINELGSGVEEEKLNKLKKWLLRFKYSEAFCKDFHESGKENYRLYKSYKDGSQNVYQHSIFVPYTYSYMEDMAAYYMLSILASPMTYSIYPRWNAVTPELCRNLEQIIHWVLTDERCEFALELEELIKNMGIFNASALINYPVLEEVKSSGDGAQTISSSFDYLHIDTPNSLCIFPDPNAKRASRANHMIIQSHKPWEELKGLEGKVYENVDDVKGGYTEGDPIKKLLQEIGMGSAGAQYDEATGMCEVLDCLFDKNVITIAGRRAIIRDTTKDLVSPYSFKFPMLDFRTSGAPGEYFGVALAESMKEPQKELNILRSQRRDNVSLLLNKLFKYDYLAGEVDLSTLFSAPGNVILTTNNDALQEFPISDIGASSYKEEEALKFDLQNITSLWDYARGGTPRRKETATGIIRLQQAAQARNEWNLKKLDLYVLVPLCRRIIINLREFLPQEDWRYIIGDDNMSEEFYSIDPVKLRKMFQIMPMTESITSIKEVDMNQFLQTFDRLIQMPDVNRVSLIKQLLEKMGNKNIKEILPQLSEAGQAGLEQGVNEFNQMPPLPGGGPGMQPGGGPQRLQQQPGGLRV